MFDQMNERGYWTSDIAALIDFRNKPTVHRALDLVGEMTGAYGGFDSGQEARVIADGNYILDLYDAGLTRKELNNRIGEFWDEQDRYGSSGYSAKNIQEIRAIREANPGMGLREAKEMWDATH